VRFTIFWLLVVNLVCVSTALAGKKDDDLWMDELLPSLSEEKKDPLYERGHQGVSLGLRSFSESIDSFFAEPRMDVESNGTRLRVNSGVTMIDNQTEQFNFGFNFNLDLPRTKKRLNLIFLTITEDLNETDEEGGNEDSVAQNPEDSLQDQDYFAGLRLFLQQNKNINISTDYGVKLTLPLDPFARIRARESVFFSGWELRFTQNLFWFETRGLGARKNIDLDKPIAKGLLFRFANRGNWRRNENVIDYSHSLNLFQTLSKRAGWVYSTGITSLSETKTAPTLDTYFVSARYRRNIYRNALFFEMQPFGNWTRLNHFGFSPGITFNLQILFGPRYMRPTEVDYL